MKQDEDLQLLADLIRDGARLRIDKPDGSFDLLDVTVLGSQGKTSLACQGRNYANDIFAVKFVPKSRYANHPIETEFERVRRLSGRFSRILYYGTPTLTSRDGTMTAQSAFYALVIEWVNGTTLRAFLAEFRLPICVKDLLSLARQMTECLAQLEKHGLVHNDLHADNIMIVPVEQGPELRQELEVRVIDSGSIKSRALRDELIAKWQNERSTLEAFLDNAPANVTERIQALSSWIKWFSREDQEWITSHLVDIYNRVLETEYELRVNERRFLAELPALLSRMVDPDLTSRVLQPKRMFEAIDLMWRKHTSPETKIMVGPFDLISAELIRSPSHINQLFSPITPWYEKCSTTDPVYIYGPRGCGKSTILRKLSLESVLADKNPKESFSALPYIGVYLSCSAELRSRFLLFPTAEYDQIAGDAVEFFTLLLAEALVSALGLLRDERIIAILDESVGLTSDCEESMSLILLEQLRLQPRETRLAGVGWFEHVTKQIRVRRAEVWHIILDRGSRRVPDCSVLFEICKQLSEVFPLLSTKHIAFLLDDYSNQRIPVALQRILNQTISFAKQGNPIFKVSSEYLGVDLEGVQQGREVVEINFGKEYVDLKDARRIAFLEDVIDIRFQICNLRMDAKKLLGKNTLSSGTPVARRIRESAGQKRTSRPFLYHGLNTVAELCSGDLALAIDIVREIHSRHEHAKEKTLPVPQRIQNDVIKEYSDNEHLHLRYLIHGRTIAYVIDRLCWLANRCAEKKESIKDGKPEPMIKTHLDISEKARRELNPEKRAILDEMIRRGCLFSLDTSRSRLDQGGTERYQVRRILLAKYVAPLARRDPIKIDHVERLLMLLDDPQEFVMSEFNKER